MAYSRNTSGWRSIPGRVALAALAAFAALSSLAGEPGAPVKESVPLLGAGGGGSVSETVRDPVGRRALEDGAGVASTGGPAGADPPRAMATSGAGSAADPVEAGQESRPLGVPGAKRAAVGIGDGSGKPAGVVDSWWAQTGLALALVVVLILLVKLGVQKLSGRSSGLAAQLGAGGRAPSGVLEVLGRFPVARGQTLVLLKMDRRILLLGQSSSGFSTLAQVSDPEEVASLLLRTRDDEGASMAARFSSLLRDMERDPVVGEPSLGLPAEGPRSPRSVLRAEGAADEPRSGPGGVGSAGVLRERLLGLRGLEA